MNWLKRYAFNWLRLGDVALNVATGGDANEMLSSRAGKQMLKGKRWACVLCRILDRIPFFGPGHCLKSINPDDGANATIPD
ncbi:hypothetical protein [Paraburkholderia sartisoli]|uniref:Uncharacterized protein n=1 Tax=Paraburkholderia sartisoli TaxID=83784 RepID=A0A1H4HT27_9BURK|nr:hypothetical protein [Paraburkholderia sartisoli]SEB24821.1 hypothetical protein SAMN05192564_11550 [Paraburkholderia sartisoli]